MPHPCCGCSAAPSLDPRIRDAAPNGVDAFLDTHGGGNADLALALDVAPDRVDTIIDFPAGKRLGIKTDGMYQLDDIRSALAKAAELAAEGRLEIPIKARFSLNRVQDAYRTLNQRSGLGKVVLLVERRF